MNKPYRRGAHALIFDQQNRLLLVQPIHYQSDEWNFPGGGREDGESPEENALREATEELGLSPNDLQVLGVSSNPNIYNFPQEIQDNKHPLAHLYRGQHKDHVYMRLANSDARVQLDKSEIRDYKWVNMLSLPNHLIFPNQYQNLIPVLEEYKKLYQNR